MDDQLDSISPFESRSFDRLINFTDAVVAIAITLQLLPLVDIKIEKGESALALLSSSAALRALAGHLYFFGLRGQPGCGQAVRRAGDGRGVRPGHRWRGAQHDGGRGARGARARQAVGRAARLAPPMLLRPA